MFVQPGGGGEDLRLGNHGIAVAVPIENRYVERGQTIIGGRGTGNGPRREETGQRNRRNIAFRVDPQQMNRKQASLRKANRHDGTVFGNVLGDPVINRARRSERIAVQIIAGRYAIMEPGIGALAEAEFARTGLLQHERCTQRGEIVIWGDVAHHIGKIGLIRAPAMQA